MANMEFANVRLFFFRIVRSSMSMIRVELFNLSTRCRLFPAPPPSPPLFAPHRRQIAGSCIHEFCHWRSICDLTSPTWLCARILLRFLFQLVLVSAAGGTSRRNSAVLIAQADSPEKRTSEGTCDMDAGKDQDSSVPTVTCIRKRSQTCTDTLGPSTEECASFSSTSPPTGNFTRERINPR